MVMPEVLVLDSEAWVRRLQNHAAQFAQEYDSCHNDHIVVDITQEVVELIRDRRRADVELRGFCAEIAAGQAHAGGDILPPALAATIWGYAQDMLRQLDEARAYLPNGVLPYQFSPRLRLQDNNTVYLTRTGELPR